MRLRLMALLAMIFLAGPVMSDDGGIRVSGHGSVTVKPDCAHVIGGVLLDHKQAGTAVKNNATAMSAVSKALVNAGNPTAAARPLRSRAA